MKTARNSASRGLHLRLYSISFQFLSSHLALFDFLPVFATCLANQFRHMRRN
jgi:hypothetical protein